VLATALAVFIVAGCGAGLRPHGGLPVIAQLETASQINSQPAGSPQRALLTWWRDVQFSNQVGYLDFLKPSVAQRELQARTAGLYLALLSGQLQPAKLEITGVDSRANLATVYARMIVHQPIGTRRYVTTTRPQAFSLERVDGRWRLVDDYFVRLIIGPELARRSSAGG
jgi:hypothetical protein